MDETSHAAADVQPEDLDEAMAIDRIERATTLRINRVTAAWAGLRTFSCDKSINPRSWGLIHEYRIFSGSRAKSVD